MSRDADIPADGPPSGFGLATATSVVISSMVGTGVLTTSGFTVYFTGSNQLMLILWVVGGVVALCGALTLCELTAALPRTGGDYVILYEAYGPLIAFLSGWVSFLIGFGGPIASSGLGAAKYLLAPAGLEGAAALVAQKALATGVILLFALVHAWHRSGSVRVQAVTTVLKIGILGALAGIGLAAGWGRWSHLADRPPLDAGTFMALGSSLVFIAYAYTGWNGVAYVAGEVERPQRRLPRAILLGTGLVLALYLALNLFYALALSAADVRAIVSRGGGKPDAVAPIAELAARRLFGARVSGVLSVLIGLTLLASLSAFVLTGPRVAYSMARAGQFPPIAGRLSGSGTPAVATALQVAWALALLWMAPLDEIIYYSGIGLSLFSMLTIASVFVLRVRRPELHRPFRTPGYPVVPALFLLISAYLIVAAFLSAGRRDVALLSLLSILLGVPAYYLWGRWARPGGDRGRQGA